MSNAFSTSALTPPAMDGVERFPVTNTVAVPSPKPTDIETHLAALKRKRELQAFLARPMTFGEFMDAWLREARQRVIENAMVCEFLRAVRREAVAGPSEPTDRRPS